MTKKSVPERPFHCQYDRAFAEILQSYQCSLVISTYSAGKLIFLSSPGKGRIIQLPRTFKKPMGVALKGKGFLSLALADRVMVFRNSPELARHYPVKPNVYDCLYMPASQYFTSALDIHDLDWVGDNLYAVNTHFSCIMRIGEKYSFEPVWHPPFIQEPSPGDACHLNGMAVSNGKVRFTSAFSQTDQPQSWRESITQTGIIMDVETNKVIADRLPMPHSPRVHKGKLYVLLSASGEMISIDISTGEQKTIVGLGRFVRGLCFFGDIAFIAHSKLRKESKTFSKLDLPGRDHNAGITAVDITSGQILGRLWYESSVDEIYDVQVIPGVVRPNILNTDKPDYIRGVTMPGRTFWAKKKEE